MRIVSVDDLTEEMILAREIVDPENGRVLLGSGAAGLPRHSQRLRGIGVYYAYVEDPLSVGIAIPAAISDEIRLNAEKSLDRVFEKCEMDQHPDFIAVKLAVKELIREILSKPEIMVNVYELHCNGGDFLSHSVNVAFLSLLLGNSLGYSDEKMRKLGVGALLHDIGVAGMPKSLLTNRRGLTVEEKWLYEQHPVLGYHQVKESWEISPLSRGVILCHHERSDGSGYPRRLMKGDIHEFARVVGLADCLEELSGGHPFSQHMKIQDSVELLNVKAESWFDKELVKTFASRIPLFQTGTTVRLSDGRAAVVVAQNKSFPTRPVVRVFQDTTGHRIDPGQEVDLLQTNHLVIL